MKKSKIFVFLRSQAAGQISPRLKASKQAFSCPTNERKLLLIELGQLKPMKPPSLEPIFYFHILILLLPAGVETGLVNEFY